MTFVNPPPLRQHNILIHSHDQTTLNHPHLCRQASHAPAAPHLFVPDGPYSRSHCTTFLIVSSDNGFSFACTACRNAEGDKYSSSRVGLVSFKTPFGPNPDIISTIWLARGRSLGSVSQHCSMSSQIFSVSPHCVQAISVDTGRVGRRPSSITLITLTCWIISWKGIRPVKT